MIYIETPRIYIRDWKRDDLKSFISLNEDPQVMQYFLKTLTPVESIAQFNKMKDEISNYGYGVFALERKEDHAFLGFTGFHNITFNVDFAPAVEICWRLHAEYWNQGYVTEAAKACLDFAQKNYDFDEVYAFTSLPNKSSERVMQKTGMMKVKEFDHPEVPENHLLKRHILYKYSL